MAHYGVEDFVRDYDVSRETCARLEQFVQLLRHWNRRVNLVSKDSLNDVWRRHIADSAQLRDVIPAYEGALIDVGSGAGFPGMVLAIMGLADIHLIEAGAKKCVFLREAARITGCQVTIHNIRLGDDSASLAALPVAAIVTARAVSPLAKLLDIVFPIVYDRTYCMFSKGMQAEDELKAARESWQFDVRQVPSKVEPGGVILKINHIRRH
ncbi:MAG: 16S rRNA (guanine(527)-N(7))-methyltransferase RsmG [Proteobacteria bacterium]|nr:16S rRNA (guanine(527)-N(7))-methyltransferase RsmG [Pseudomonadota bacterium]MDA1356185.1 16S rRNA (guanine(527)-N(7))-methyltransferase RsmG [Pseudomonadota bacterium]